MLYAILATQVFARQVSIFLASIQAGGLHASLSRAGMSHASKTSEPNMATRHGMSSSACKLKLLPHDSYKVITRTASMLLGAHQLELLSPMLLYRPCGPQQSSIQQ